MICFCPQAKYDKDAAVILLAAMSYMILSTSGMQEAKRHMFKYTPEELKFITDELDQKGYTKNIEVYFDFARSNLLTTKIQITKYKIKSGENFWTLSRRFRINKETVVGANPYFKVLDPARTGQEIILVNRIGVLHRIKEKETLDTIAALLARQK